MAIDFQQLWEEDGLQAQPLRDSINSVSATQHWVVSGAPTEVEALDALRAKLYGASYSGLELQSLQIAEHLSIDTWKIDAVYGQSSFDFSGSEETPAEVTTYSLSNTTINQTHSLKTVRSYSSTGSAARNHHGAMNVEGGQINGMDINVSTATMNISHYYPIAAWTTNLRNRILLTGNTVNSHRFRGFYPGELLFTGANISPENVGGRDYIHVDFQFAISPNDSNVELHGWTGPTIQKEGWNVMWVDWGRHGNDDSSLKPLFVYIEKVYKSFNFAEYGLDPNK